MKLTPAERKRLAVAIARVESFLDVPVGKPNDADIIAINTLLDLGAAILVGNKKWMNE
jgi:hypothetical protein